MSQEFVLGLNAKLYRRVGGTFAAPVWGEVKSVRAVDTTFEAGSWDGSTRGSKFRKWARTLLDVGFDLELLHKPGDTDQAALRTAFLDGSMVDIAVMDGDIEVAGSEGFRAEMQVFSFSRGEPLEEGLLIKCSVKPGISDNEPEYLVIA